MTRRVGRNVSWHFRGKLALTGLLCALSLVLLLPDIASAASCSSDQFGNRVCGMDVSVPAGQLFSGVVATYSSAGEWAPIRAEIAWGDGASSVGDYAGGETTASHLYSVSGTYAISVTINFQCTAVDLICTARAGQPSPAQGTADATVEVAPDLTSAPGATFQVGRRGSFLLTTTGIPAAHLSLSGALPAGLDLTDNGDGTAVLEGTPAPGTGGAYPLTLTAANGLAPDATQSFVLMVQAPPVAAITAPRPGDVYTRGASVQSTFACREGPGGPGLSACDDSRGTDTAHGGSGYLDTSTLGTHTYTVTATSSDGLSSGTTISYTVVAPASPALTLQSPPPRLRIALGFVLPVELRHGRVRLTLSCSGGAPASHCAGRLVLSARIRYVSYVRRRLVARARVVRLSLIAYAVASGGQRSLAPRLSPLAQRLIAEAPSDDLAVHATVTLAGGEAIHRTLTLRTDAPAGS